MRDHVIVSGKTCKVERLSRAGMLQFERESAPVAEVFAPDGYQFSGGETSLCVHSAQDLDAIERDETLTVEAEIEGGIERE